MNIDWVKSIKDPEERKKFEQYLRANTKLLDMLTQIVYNYVRESEHSLDDDYDSPSWAYKAADRNGEARAYKKVLKLLDLRSSNERP